MSCIHRYVCLQTLYFCSIYQLHHVRIYTIPHLMQSNISSVILAMQNEHTVIRLEWQAIHTNYSYILDELAPDVLVPYLEERRLLSPEKAQHVTRKSSRLQKMSTILQTLKESSIVGRLPTFCAALISAGQPHIARKLAHSEN